MGFKSQLKTVCGHEVDVGTQRRLPIALETCKPQKPHAGRRVHEKIDIAVFTVVPSNGAAEKPRSQHAMPGKNAEDLIVTALKSLALRTGESVQRGGRVLDGNIEVMTGRSDQPSQGHE